MNIGSFLFIFIIFYIFIRSRNVKNIFINLLVLTTVIELTIERGYFIQIGSQQIAYRTVSEALLTVVSIWYLFSTKKGISPFTFNGFAVLTVCIFLGWVSLILFPTNAKGGTMAISWDDIITGRAELQEIVFIPAMYTEIIQIVMYLIIGLGVWSCTCKKDWEYIIEKATKFLYIFLWFCMLEVFFKYGFSSTLFDTVTDAILGHSISTVSGLVERGSGYVMCGLTKEASHYSFNLTVTLLLFYINYATYKSANLKKKISRNKIGMILCAILMVAIMSFSSVYNLCCVALFIFCVHTEKNGNSLFKMWVIFSGAVVCAIAIVNILPHLVDLFNIQSFFGRRMLSLIEELSVISNGTWLSASTALEWSNRVRLGSTYETLKLVFYRPIFGLGFASTSAHSSFAMLVSGCGFIGTFYYIRAIFFSTRTSIRKSKKGVYISGIIVFLLLTLFSSLSLRPYYEAWNTVFAMSLLLFVSEKSKVNEIPAKTMVKMDINYESEIKV